MLNVLYCVLKAEHLKYRRTTVRRLIVPTPLLFMLIGWLAFIFMPQIAARPWSLLLAVVYNWWPVTFIPFGTALFASLVAQQEKKAGNFHHLRVHPHAPSLYWIGKIAIMGYYTFLMTSLLMIDTVLVGRIITTDPIPWGTILFGGLLMWFASLPLIPLQLWAATWKGTSLGMLIGALGFLIGVVVAPKAYWMAVPWSWPIRLMSPLVGVHPNGVLLKADDPLWDSSVIPVGIVLSIVATVLLTGITALWFHQREAR